jgi:hypothetical protein
MDDVAIDVHDGVHDTLFFAVHMITAEEPKGIVEEAALISILGYRITPLGGTTITLGLTPILVDFCVVPPSLFLQSKEYVVVAVREGVLYVPLLTPDIPTVILEVAAQDGTQKLKLETFQEINVDDP